MSSTVPDALIRYMQNAPIALALGAIGTPDEPLVSVNDAFCRLTGYAESDVVGKNCRFLQPETEDTKDARAQMRAFLDDPSVNAGRFEVPNMRADGSRFDNFVFMSRLKNQTGEGSFIFASQFDLSAANSYSELKTYDHQLGKSIEDVTDLGKNFGLIMRQSAELLSQSAATIAGIRLHG